MNGIYWMLALFFFIVGYKTKKRKYKKEQKFKELIKDKMRKRLGAAIDEDEKSEYEKIQNGDFSDITSTDVWADIDTEQGRRKAKKYL